MTKSQEDVVRAALDVLDEYGYSGVSVRAVARHLGVRMNTVLWHAKSKARLDELLADAIVSDVSFNGLPDHWRDRAAEIARRYRAALLSHRDGAAVVAGTYASEPATFDVAEALISALLDGGLTDRAVAWTCWCLIYFVLGLCQEQQGLTSQHPSALDVGRRPGLQRVLPVLIEGSFDERFEFGVAKLLA